MGKTEEIFLIDVDNIMKFVFESDMKRDTDSEITETYIADENDGDMVLTTKQYREVKGGDNTSKQTIRYDLIKTMLEMIADMDFNAQTFRESLIFNTLCNEGIIKLVKED